MTAGKYKRTLTPFKKPTEEDIKKTTEDIAQVHPPAAALRR